MARGKVAQDISISSDKLHNRNCFAYLQVLYGKLPAFLLNTFEDKLKKRLNDLADKKYKENYAYGILYKDFFEYLEENLDRLIIKPLNDINQRLLDKSRQLDFVVQNSHATMVNQFENSPETIKKKRTALCEFIHCIYHNESSILPQTYHHIEHTIHTHRPSDSKKLERKISSRLKDTGPTINKGLTPAIMGSKLERFAATYGSNFKPQHTTSLATIRQFDYKDSNDPIEYRFGTQGQRHEEIARVSPLFEAWLSVQRLRSSHPDKPTHIYFNLLGFHRDDMEGVKEVDLTCELHGLEARHPNIAVITLPADKGFMAENEYQYTQRTYATPAILQEFLNIACQSDKARSSVQDFFISERVRMLAFSKDGAFNKTIEREILQTLLTQSLQDLNISEPSISRAECQAIWFHFNKYILPDYLIRQLKPEGINFTCKDAIDRGGVASAYYNLIKSFKAKTPITREAFEETLHAAAAMVKGRGLNHHLKLIWNAVDAYVNANYKDILSHADKSWLIQWRDLNCPHARVSGLLTRRIQESITELNDLKSESPSQWTPGVFDQGIAVLSGIERQAKAGLSGQRLLLEAVSSTAHLIKNPTEDEIIRYQTLANDLTINYPALYIVGGLLKSFLGSLLFAISLGYADHIMESGWATFKTGLSHSDRHIQTTGMLELSKKMSTALLMNDAINAYESNPSPVIAPIDDKRDLEIQL